MTYVIVYGTLKTGYHNNRLLFGAEFVGKGIVEDHKLYYSGFPVAKPSPGDSIRVEVFKLSESQKDRYMAQLDRLEGYDEATDRGMYLRRTQIVKMENGKELLGQMYVGPSAFWTFDRMSECPKDDQGIYYWVPGVSVRREMVA